MAYWLLARHFGFGAVVHTFRLCQRSYPALHGPKDAYVRHLMLNWGHLEVFGNAANHLHQNYSKGAKASANCSGVIGCKLAPKLVLQIPELHSETYCHTKVV